MLDLQNQSEVKENNDQDITNTDSLSKTQSKEAIMMKFRKANLKNIGIQNIRKNVQINKNQKIKLIGSS